MTDRPARTAHLGGPSATQRLVRVIRRALPLVLLTGLLCGAVAALATQAQRDTYTSAVTFVVQTNTGANDSETLIRTMMALIPTQITGEDLRRRAQVDSSPSQITSNLDIQRPPGSAVITVTYRDHDLAKSRAVASQLVPVFSSRLSRLSEPQAGQLAANYSVLPWGDGSVTTESSPPPVQRNAGIGLLLGLLLGIGVAVVQSQWRPLVLSGTEPALARVRMAAVLPGSRRGSRVSGSDAMLRVAEVVEQYAGPEPWVLVTGPANGRRRTRFVSDLAEAFTALSGRDVQVVDADDPRRSPQQRAAGLAELQQPGDARSAVVVKGPDLPGPAPVLSLLPLVDVVVVVAQAGRTSVQDVLLADAMLSDGSHRPVLTVLLDGSHFYAYPSPAPLEGSATRSQAALASS